MVSRNYKPEPRLSAGPLRDYLLSRISVIAAEGPHEGHAEQIGAQTVQKLYGIDIRTWRNIFERDYVFMKYADNICGRLGMHPCELWGDEWFTA